MNFFKRIGITLQRKKGKTVAMFSILALLGTLLSGAISIQQAITQSEDRLWQRIPATLVIRNADPMNWHRTDIPTNDMVEQLGNLPQVRSFSSSNAVEVVGENIRAFLEPDNVIALSEQAFGIDRDYRLWARGILGGQAPEFESGLLRLIDGQSLEEAGNENGIVISREVAVLNNLSVGSKFHLSSMVHPDSPYESSFSPDSPKEIFQVEVVGIFDLVSDFDTGHRIFDDQRRDQILNTVYVSYSLVAFLGEQGLIHAWPYLDIPGATLEGILASNEQIWQNAVFFLNDWREMESFRQAASEILPPLWELEDYSGVAFPQMVGAMDNMNQVADMILYGAIGAISIITILLVLFYLKDIKQEIGIYLALGESKIRIVLRTVAEIVIISLASFSLATVFGHQLAATLSQTMLQNDLLEQGENPYVESGWFEMMSFNDMGNSFDFHNPTDMSFEDMIATYDVSLGTETVLTIFAIGLTVIVLSTGIATLYIWRLPPKDILIAHN